MRRLVECFKKGKIEHWQVCLFFLSLCVYCGKCGVIGIGHSRLRWLSHCIYERKYYLFIIHRGTLWSKHMLRHSIQLTNLLLRPQSKILKPTHTRYTPMRSKMHPSMACCYDATFLANIFSLWYYYGVEI